MHAFVQALVLSLPPRGRVNYRCYPVWNANKASLNVVWNGAEYMQPWAFDTDTDTYYSACRANSCVQRLWCTDSGAVGRYITGERPFADNVTLEYAWLLNTSLSGRRVLAVSDRETGAMMTRTSEHGHGTVLVVGNTLYFYTYGVSRTIDGYRMYRLPRLSSLIFAEYDSAMNASHLVQMGLNAAAVLECTDEYVWESNR